MPTTRGWMRIVNNRWQPASVGYTVRVSVERLPPKPVSVADSRPVRESSALQRWCAEDVAAVLDWPGRAVRPPDGADGGDRRHEGVAERETREVPGGLLSVAQAVAVPEGGSNCSGAGAPTVAPVIRCNSAVTTNCRCGGGNRGADSTRSAIDRAAAGAAAAPFEATAIEALPGSTVRVHVPKVDSTPCPRQRKGTPGVVLVETVPLIHMRYSSFTEGEVEDASNVRGALP